MIYNFVWWLAWVICWRPYFICLGILYNWVLIAISFGKEGHPHQITSSIRTPTGCPGFARAFFFFRGKTSCRRLLSLCLNFWGRVGWIFYFIFFFSGFLPETLRIWRLCCVYICLSDISVQLHLNPSANFNQAQQTWKKDIDIQVEERWMLTGGRLWWAKHQISHTKERSDESPASGRSISKVCTLFGIRNLTSQSRFLFCVGLGLQRSGCWSFNNVTHIFSPGWLPL